MGYGRVRFEVLLMTAVKITHFWHVTWEGFQFKRQPSTLKVEVMLSPKSLVNVYQTTRHHTPEDGICLRHKPAFGFTYR
jgi:hypothetical protein